MKNVQVAGHKTADDPVGILWKVLQDRVSTDGGLGGLTDKEKVFFALYVLGGEVYNGGAHQFFSNCPAEVFTEVYRGLALLKEQETLDLLNEAGDILFEDGKVPTDLGSRNDRIKQCDAGDNEPMPEWVVAIGRIDRALRTALDKGGANLLELAKQCGLVKGTMCVVQRRDDPTGDSPAPAGDVPAE
jgi:hypothetical protein